MPGEFIEKKVYILVLPIKVVGTAGQGGRGIFFKG